MDANADSRFTDDEWRALAVGPVAAASAMIATSRPGFVGIIKEARAGMKAMKAAAPAGAAAGLVEELLAYADSHDDLSAGLSTDGDDKDAARMASLEAIDRAVVVTGKLDAEEHDGYANWLVGIARAMAEAVPDKGEDAKVSTAEEATIAEIEHRLRSA